VSEFNERQEFMPCKFCDSTKATLVRVTRNINGGDLDYPHAHFNLLYNCNYCGLYFVVRIYLTLSEYLKKLYYGDIDDGDIMDMSPATQYVLREKGLPLKETMLTEKSKTVKEFVQYLDAHPEAFDGAGLDLDKLLQHAYEKDELQSNPKRSE
jgi:hypothetical protein